MLTDERVRRYLGAGMHMAVGTADAQGNPCVCDAVALEVQPSGSAVTVYLPVAIAAETVANLATNGRVAIVSTFPPDHGTVQLKGRSRAVRLAGEEQRALVAGSLERLADVLDEIGLPRAITLSVQHWPAFAVDVDVEAVFDQTPGPRAGELLRSR